MQDDKLHITVIACKKLKDTEWFTQQDPYVELEYGGTKFRTETCKNGGRNPKFGDEFEITLSSSVRAIDVSVWNRNRMQKDAFIGSGRIQLKRVLDRGYDGGVWQLQTKSSTYAGDLRVIMHYPKESVTSRILGCCFFLAVKLLLIS